MKTQTLRALLTCSCIVNGALAAPQPSAVDDPVVFSIPPPKPDPTPNPPNPPAQNRPEKPSDSQNGKFLTWRPTDDKYTLYFHAGCTDEQIVDLRLSWAEAGLLANAFAQWVPGGLYQNVMDKYMGTDSVKTAWFATSPKSQIQYVSKNMMTLHSGGFTWSSTEVYMYCEVKDAPSPQNTLCNGRAQREALAWAHTGAMWNTLSITFCEKYWRDVRSLADAIKNVGDDPAKIGNIYSYYDTKADVIFHETMHWSPTISSLSIEDRGADGREVYGPELVEEEAKTANAASTIRISDAYTLAAEAMYAMRRFNLTEVPAIPKSSLAALNGADSVGIRDRARNPQDPLPPPPHDLDDANATPDPAVWKRNDVKPVLDTAVYGDF